MKIMPMTTVYNLSGEAGRTFAIAVTGSPHQASLRTGAYTIRVPYSSLAKTIHSIGQRGGKVVDVKMLTAPLTDVADIPVAAGFVLPGEETATAQVPTATEIDDARPAARRQQSKSKKR
jgi:CpcD/allophycocyanin linker domain